MCRIWTLLAKYFYFLSVTWTSSNNQKLFGTKAVCNSPFSSRRTRCLTLWRAWDSVSGCCKPVSVCHHRRDTDDKTINVSAFLFSWFIVSLHECSHTITAHAFNSTVSSISRAKSFIPWKQNSCSIKILNTFDFAHARRLHSGIYVKNPAQHVRSLASQVPSAASVAWCCQYCYWKFHNTH